MSARSAWIEGLRPRTLAAGIAPVLVGTAAADRFIAWRFVAAMLVALGLQIGVNLANDLHDGVRGVDTPDRVGPQRLVSSGAATPAAVRAAALAAIAVAAIAGLALAAATTWWLLAMGAAAIVALWLYSGGPRPYAGLGLGELMVFVFFGLVATAGSAFVQDATVAPAAWWGGASMGLLAVAILIANNLRDIPTDEVAGKRTLAVRIGSARSRALYRAAVIVAFVLVPVGVFVGFARPDLGTEQWSLFALPAWVYAIRPMERIAKVEGRDLIEVLAATARVQLLFGALLAIGLWAAP